MWGNGGLAPRSLNLGTNANKAQRCNSRPGQNIAVPNVDVLLTVHLSIFILVINQLDAHKFLFYNKFISYLYMFRAPRAHHQVVKIALHSLWYHHSYRWPSRTRDGHLKV